MAACGSKAQWTSDSDGSHGERRFLVICIRHASCECQDNDSLPGLYLCGFLTPPVDGADLRAALEASCLRGALPPVDLPV